MTKLRILFLTSSYPSNKNDNSGIFLHELAKRLKDNFEVFVLTPNKGKLLKRDILDGIKIYKHKQSFTKRIKIVENGPIMSRLRINKLYWLMVPNFILMQFLGLKKIVKKEKISIIHAHWIIPQGLVAVMYKKFINSEIKILVTIHGTDFNGFSSGLAKRLIWFVLNNINELTVVSNAIKKEIINMGYRKKIHVRPMGLDTKLFNPDKKTSTLKEELGIIGPFLLFVGSLIKTKGIEQLVEAIPEIVKVFNNLKLVVVGLGNMRTKLIEKAKELGIDKNVIFIGEIPNRELPKYFATANLLILPSFTEGLPVSIMEALSSGTIVLVSPLEPLRDLVTENETGFFIKEITTAEISQKVIYILKNIDNQNSIKINARKKIVEKYDWEITKNHFAKIYLNMLEFDENNE